MVQKRRASALAHVLLSLWHQLGNLGTYVTSIAYDPLPDANVGTSAAPGSQRTRRSAVDPYFANASIHRGEWGTIGIVHY